MGGGEESNGWVLLQTPADETRLVLYWQLGYSFALPGHARLVQPPSTDDFKLDARYALADLPGVEVAIRMESIPVTQMAPEQVLANSARGFVAVRSGGEGGKPTVRDTPIANAMAVGCSYALPGGRVQERVTHTLFRVGAEWKQVVRIVRFPASTSALHLTVLEHALRTSEELGTPAAFRTVPPHLWPPSAVVEPGVNLALTAAGRAASDREAALGAQLADDAAVALMGKLVQIAAYPKEPAGAPLAPQVLAYMRNDVRPLGEPLERATTVRDLHAWCALAWRALWQRQRLG